MGTLRLNYGRVSVKEDYGDFTLNTLSAGDFAKFNAGILGLGPVSKEAAVINALAAVVDLEGFTDFCNQIDPQLVIPEFLAGFLDWLFADVKKRFCEKETETGVRIWGSLPFFGKFTGDGVLFLWNTDYSGGLTGIGNIARIVREICKDYATKFVPTAAQGLIKVPARLRAGIARGQVLSIGGGNDFVGPCINMASRLQKLGPLSFAVSRRGFDPKECFGEGAKDFVLKMVDVRGVGEGELVFVLKEEFAAHNTDSIFASEKTPRRAVRRRRR